MTENALIGDLTARRARLDGTAVALICGDQRVDFNTLERTVKDSGRWYQQLVATHRIPA